MPERDGGWHYVATADGIVYAVDDDRAEAERIAWLETHLGDNGLCPAGYEVTDRTALLVQQHWLGDVYRIHYRGHCLDG